jgi:hypothetical protein
MKTIISIGMLVLLLTISVNVYAFGGCDMVLIEKESWVRAGFGNVGIHTFTIRNYGDVDVKDLTIFCSYYGRSDTKIGSNSRTIYDVVKGKKTKKFSKINMGFISSQAVGCECEIFSCKKGE